MISNINVLIRILIQICFLQRKPQDLPASYVLLMLCLVIYTLANILLALHKVTMLRALQASLLESLLVTVITLVILVLSHHGRRWLQTLTALSGTGCIMSLLALPVFFGSTFPAADTVVRIVILLFYLGLLAWNITIMAHILRHALDTSFVIGVIFALTYVFITSILINLAIPELEVA